MQDPEFLERPALIALGAGIHQQPVIQAARRLGYPVAAVDQNPRAPGFADASWQIHSSILRPRRIARAALEELERPVAGVVARSFGAATLSAALVSRRLGLHSENLRSLRFFRNKRRAKLRLQEAGVPSPQILGWANDAQRQAILEMAPVLARPAGGHAKRGILVLESAGAIESFLRDHPDDDGRWLVEPFVEGREITVLAFAIEGKAHPLFVSDKLVSERAPRFAEVEHRFPSSLEPSLKARIRDLLDRTLLASGYRNGPLVAEFLAPDDPLDPSRELLLIECNPETGGEYLAETLGKFALGHDYFEDLVRLSAGDSPDLSPYLRPPERAIIIRFALPQRAGKVHSVRLAPDSAADSAVIFARSLKQAGDMLSLHSGNLDRIAVYAMQGPIDAMPALIERANEYARNTELRYE
ncbi:MAG: hypothetical protein K1X75_09105 [Leptospirales bacterium]|nr:hypothetical protein [Leptospirales bacterium]